MGLFHERSSRYTACRMTPTESQALDRIALLAEPVRRRLYEFVVGQAGPVDRDAAANGAGIGRPLAAFHLDRLAEAGLLDVTYRRRSGRTGPGAGRPAKFYARAPPRRAQRLGAPAALRPRRDDPRGGRGTGSGLGRAGHRRSAGARSSPGGRGGTRPPMSRRS